MHFFSNLLCYFDFRNLFCFMRVLNKDSTIKAIKNTAQNCAKSVLFFLTPCQIVHIEIHHSCNRVEPFFFHKTYISIETIVKCANLKEND